MEALIVVDIQNDFLPGGALGVPQGDEVVPVANAMMDSFELVCATQDWHPPEHKSFAANTPGKEVGESIELNGIEQILWPVHCVQNTKGAEFAPGLRTDKFSKIFHKGVDVEIDSYSTFFDNGHRRSTGLDAFLKERDVDKVYLLGLATDYCVKYSARDAIDLGFDTNVIEDGCRGVNLNPGDVDKAVEELKETGVKFTQSEQLK